MVVIGKELYQRLIARNGQPLSAENLGKQREDEAGFRKWQHEGRGEDENSILTQLEEDFLKRFEFEIVGRESIDGRASHVVRVAPRKGLHAKELQHKVMARMAGRMCIDENEFEVVKLEFGLSKPVHIG